MPTSFTDYVHVVQRLHQVVVDLECASQELELTALADREWYALLTQKLIPQLHDDAFLVVAVVGGTNIGKSVILNHIAGCRASATSPLASGTRHPVCLVPPGFPEHHDLRAVFPDFELAEWSTPDEATQESVVDRLYWRTSPEAPDNLLVLDTPDIDSDVKVNWRRADNIRRSADVLIAVLTQQKYNDAAVRRFFEKAAGEGKAVIVVFNQCQLPDDEIYWPVWLETFSRQTGIEPEFVYVAPNDRAAAEANRLPFYEGATDSSATQVAPDAVISPIAPERLRDLGADLARLRFGEIKVRTLSGSLDHLLDSDVGVASYLAEVTRRSHEFRAALELLTAGDLAHIDHWPPVPNAIMISMIRQWWQTQREGWPARIHGFYNTIGRGLAWPLRLAGRSFQGKSVPVLERYRRVEWRTILDAIDAVYRQLQSLSESCTERLKPRLEHALHGQTRARLIQIVQEAHALFDLEEALKNLVATEMQSFRNESPQYYTFLKRLDALGAAVRPATSIALFLTGFGPVGHAATQLVTDSAVQSAVHVAGDLAGGTLAATVGESALSATAATGTGYLEAKFRNLHAAFAQQRAGWLAGLLQEHLLGPLPRQLREAANLPDSPAFHSVQRALADLQSIMAGTSQQRIA